MFEVSSCLEKGENSKFFDYCFIFLLFLYHFEPSAMIKWPSIALHALQLITYSQTQIMWPI